MREKGKKKKGLPGRMGFSAGLTLGTFVGTFLPLPTALDDDATVAERGLLPPRDLPLAVFSCCVCPCPCTPSLPRFMMLAGVTGVISPDPGVGVLSELTPALDNDTAAPPPCRKFIGASGCGVVAGGGIDRSTGEGVSPGMSAGLGPPRRPPPRVEAGKSGVEFADFVPRRLGRLLVAVVLPMMGVMLCGRRFTAACRLRDGRPVVLVISSLPGEAVRRFVPVPVDAAGCTFRGGAFADDWLAFVLVLVLYAPSHGLVSGDISSKSSSAGEGSGYGLVMFWNTIFAGAECGAEGMTCCGTKEGWCDCCC